MTHTHERIQIDIGKNLSPHKGRVTRAVDRTVKPTAPEKQGLGLGMRQISASQTVSNIGPLAMTTRGVTHFSPEVAAHAKRAEIEAHEAVHQAQFASYGQLPLGNVEQLESEARDGARVLVSGGTFELRHAAPVHFALAMMPEDASGIGPNDTKTKSVAEQIVEEKGIKAEKLLVLGFFFLKGLYGGLKQNLTFGDFVALIDSLIEADRYIDKSPEEFHRGIADGIQAEIDGLKDLIEQLPNLPQILAELGPKLVTFLSSGAVAIEISEAIGTELGQVYAAAIKEAAELGPQDLSYKLGRLLAPILIEILITLIGVAVAGIFAGLFLPRFYTVFTVIRRAGRALEPVLDMIRKRIPTRLLRNDIDLDLDRSFDRTFDQDVETPGTGSQTPTVAPETAAGFTQAQIRAFRRMLGRRFTDGEIEVLGRLWRDAANPGEAAQLTSANSRRLFDNHRGRFWRRVRQNDQARSIFEDAGCVFEGGNSTAPIYRMGNGQEVRMTIDHIVERQTAPHLALDPSNLRIAFSRENSVVLRLLHDLDPFLNQQSGRSAF